jgi:hypothetical protein
VQTIYHYEHAIEPKNSVYKNTYFRPNASNQPSTRQTIFELEKPATSEL